MKCVKNEKVVIRVDNYKAQRMVKSGKWEYACKEEWKEGGRKRA